MSGPLLISLLPPEQICDPAFAVSGSMPFVVAILLLIGFLLSLFLRHPGH